MTRYRVTFDRKAEKQINAVRIRWLAEDLRDAIMALGENPRPPGCLKMSGSTDEWRIRVGDWRVVYRIDDGCVVVIVVRVAPRGGVYR
jgi:mRNA interferase RelE/StbE